MPVAFCGVLKASRLSSCKQAPTAQADDFPEPFRYACYLDVRKLTFFALLGLLKGGGNCSM
jgi:hypothetical protein